MKRLVPLMLAALTALAGCSLPEGPFARSAAPAKPTSAPWTSQRLEGQLLGIEGATLFLLGARDAGRSLALPLPAPAAPVERSVAASVTANQVAVFTQEGGSAVHLLDLATGQVKVVALAPPGPSRGLAWSADGRFLVWGAANTVGRIDRSTARPEELVRGASVDAVLGATPAGEALYQAGDQVMLVGPGRFPAVLGNGLAEAGFASPLSPDGQTIIVSRCTELCQGVRGTGPDHATVYNGFALDRRTGVVRQVTQRRATAGLTGRGAVLGWLPDNRRLLWVVRNYSDQPSSPDRIFRVDATSAEVLEVFSSRDLYTLRMGPDGRTLYMHTICCGRPSRPAGFYVVDLATGGATAAALPDRPGIKILGVF